METERLPWLFAVLTAGWFGWMAHRMGRNSILWAVGGAAFGLVTSALVIGLGDASTISFSDHARKVSDAKWAGAAVVLIGAIGWLLTAGLHRRQQLNERGLKPDSAPIETGAVNPVNPPGRKFSS